MKGGYTVVDKDRRKFLDEIYFIGEQKEFKELFGKMINPMNLVKKTDEILLEKRKAYNYAFCRCCEKYNIQNIDDIYKNFDEIWSKSEVLNGEKMIIPGIFSLVFRNPQIVISKFQDRIQIKWYSYIEKTREFANGLDNGWK